MFSSDGNDIQLHERIFAQVLGVEENEEFATELTYYAADLLQTLPPGWILEIGEGELAGIPLFVFTDTDETEWNHPYESEYRRRIQTKRNELYEKYGTNNLNAAASVISGVDDNAGINNMEFNASNFNASSIATDFTENVSPVFDVVPPVAEIPNEDEASESPVASDQLQDFEILFGQVLGVKLDEKHFLPLAYLAKELLKIIPDGWELLLSKSDAGVRVPYYYEQATRTSHWIHPYENQYKDLISKKRQDLLASASQSPSPVPSPIPTPMSTARSFVSESSINSTDRMALIEAMFAGAVGISPFEEFASELGDFAKELLMTLPAGWEVVIADTGKTTEIFPLFVNTFDNSSQLEHPLLAEHTQSIEEMRTTLLYGVLPSEFSQYESEAVTAGAGAGAESSADFLAQEAARQAEEEMARSIATVKSFEARIAEAERVAAERAAADQKAKAEASEAVDTAPVAEKTEAELKAELKAERKAERIRQNEESQAAVKEAVRQAHIAREAAEQALKEAQEARIAEEEAAEQEALRLKEIADQIEAEARAVQEAIEVAEKERLLQEKLAAEIRAEEEEAALVEAARAEIEAQQAAELAAERAIQERIEAEAAAQRALEEEKEREIVRAREAAEAEARAIKEAEERAAAEIVAAEAARIAEETRLLEEARREEERIEQERLQEAERIASAVRIAALLEEVEKEAVGVVEEAITLAVEKVQSLEHVPSAPVVISTTETVIMEGWVMSPPVPSTPMDSSVAFWEEPTEPQDGTEGSVPIDIAAAESEVIPELSPEEIEAKKIAELDATAEIACIEAEVEHVVEETVAALLPELALESVEAMRQEAIDKERALVEAREAEERDAKERAEKRLAQRKAAEAAAQEALRKAEEEERALEEAAKELFRKELELARQASFLSTARTGTEEDPSEVPVDIAITTEGEEVEIIETGDMVEVVDNDEPDVLALTIPPGGIDFTLQPESPDSARMPHISVQELFTADENEPSAPKEITSSDLLAAAQSNAIRMKTQYLDLSKPIDKGTRLTSKRNSVVDSEKVLTAKSSVPSMSAFAGAGIASKSNIDLRTGFSDAEDHLATVEDSDNEGVELSEADAAHRKKDWKSKILRPLSKVSPKKEAQRRRRAISRNSAARSPSPGRVDTRKERLWEMKVDESEAAVEVGRMKWYRLGCYKTYEEAVKARKVVLKMIISDSQGTIIVDPRIDISDADLVATLNQTMSFDTFNSSGRGITSTGAESAGLGISKKFGTGSRATTASPTFHRGAGAGANAVAGLNASHRSMSGFGNNNPSTSRPGTTAEPFSNNTSMHLGTSQGSRLHSAASTQNATMRSTLSSAPAGATSGPFLPAANDTRELILGRVMRTTEKMAKLRVRKDLGRMQWVLETDDFEANKITDRHRKKKGVDIEGKVENVVSGKAKRALKAMEAAREEHDDFATQTLKKLPAMEELLEANLLEVLATSKSFGTFSLTSQLVASERQLKEEIETRVGKIKNRMASPNGTSAGNHRAVSNGKREPKNTSLSSSPSRISPNKLRARSVSPEAGVTSLKRAADSSKILMNNTSSRPNNHSSVSKKHELAAKLVLPEIGRKVVI